MDSDGLLTAARAFRAEAEELRLRQIAEFDLTRPTPNQDECDRAAVGEVVMIKEWDLSPIDPRSFDPFEPPGRPAAPPSPPSPTLAPAVTAVTDLVVGSTLTTTNGTWTGSPTYARQWKRNTTNVGSGATTYTLVALDVGAMISCDVTATNAGGGVTASSNSVGPIVDAGAQEPEGGDDGESVQPTRRRR